MGSSHSIHSNNIYVVYLNYSTSQKYVAIHQGGYINFSLLSHCRIFNQKVQEITITKNLSCTCPGHVPDAPRTSPYCPVFWPMSRFHEDTGQAPKC